MDVLVIEPLERARGVSHKYYLGLVMTYSRLGNITPVQEKVLGFGACKFEGYSQLVATYDYSHIRNWNRASTKIVYEGGGSRVLVESP